MAWRIVSADDTKRLSKSLRDRLHDPTLEPTKKPSKYRATAVIVDGIRFDSTKEARRWQTLSFDLSRGAIRDLERQVTYRLTVNEIEVGKIVVDFQYRQGDSDTLIVEDVKPFDRRTQRFRLTKIYVVKKKLLKALYGLTVIEV